MFGISFEHILIIGVVLLLFGPKRLPELGKSLGKSIKNFKDSFNGMEDDSKSRGERIEKLAETEKEPDDHPENKS
jgi:sec-independent protein translocase protein TatA